MAGDNSGFGRQGDSRDGVGTRGVFTEDDRKYLSGQKEVEPSYRGVIRNRIRRRILNSLLDGELFEYIEERDRKQIFKAGDDEYPIILPALKNYLKFVYRGMRDMELYEPHQIISGTFEDGIREMNAENGRVVDLEVCVKVEDFTETNIHKIEEKFRDGGQLGNLELQALDNHPDIQISLVELIVHRQKNGTLSEMMHAKRELYDIEDELSSTDSQPESDKFSDLPSLRNTTRIESDPKLVQEFIDHLVDILEENNIDSYNDFRKAEKLSIYGYAYQDLYNVLKNLRRVAPLNDGIAPTAAEMFSYRDKSARRVLEAVCNNSGTIHKIIKPPDTGPDWSPRTDKELHRTIAKVEAQADVVGDFVSPRPITVDHERWKDLKRKTGFDPAEWKHEIDQEKRREAEKTVKAELRNRLDPRLSDSSQIQFDLSGYSRELVENQVRYALPEYKRYDDDELEGLGETLDWSEGELEEIRSWDLSEEEIQRTVDDVCGFFNIPTNGSAAE